MVNASYKNPSGLRTYISAEQGNGKIEFSCETGDSECHHSLKQNRYAEFIEAIGQPTDRDAFTAITKVMRSNPRKVDKAIHSEITKTEFTWVSG